MPQIVVGKAIEGCDDPWEELALAFCRAVDSEARDIHRLMQLRKEAESITGMIPDAERAQEEAQTAVTAAAEEVAEASKFDFADPLVLGGLFVAVVGGVVGGLLRGDDPTKPPALWIGGPVGAGVLLLVVYLIRRGSAISAATARLNAAEEALAAAAEQAEGLRNRLQQLKSEMASIKPRRSVQAVGRVYFPAVLTSINQTSVLIDRSGMVSAKPYKLANFSFDSAELAELVSRIEVLRNPPVLLAPDESAGQAVDALHGEERLLRETVEKFSDFVGRIPTVEVSLTTIPRKSGVGDDLARGVVFENRFPGATIRDRNSPDPKPQVDQLNMSLRKTKSQGAAPKVELLQAHARIDELLRLYQSLRTTSIQAIQTQLIEVMEKSSWCNVVFHCPKMTRNPAWLERRLGIDVKTAHELPQDRLMERLQTDPEIAQRIEDDQALVKQLDQAFMGLCNLNDQVQHIRQLAQNATSGVGLAQLGSPIAMAALVRQLESQREQYVAQYQLALNRIVFGQRAPHQEYSDQSRLTFDPRTMTWSNETAGTEYVDMDEIGPARVLRVHQELLHPMWRHLWTEKADFRKSELFRSNEQAMRMSEKESEKLIIIANQFRDDLRMTREVLKQVQGELEGKVEQLSGTREALLRLGLLDPRDAGTLSEEAIAEFSSGGSNYLRSAEEKETMLSLEPQAQAERRETLMDPIGALALPDQMRVEDDPAAYRSRLVRSDVSMSERVQELARGGGSAALPAGGAG